MTPNVQNFCLKLWEAREGGTLPGASMISRTLALAVAADVLDCESYDPYEDRRVEWAQGVVKARTWLRPQLRPEADGNLEYLLAGLLGKAEVPVLSGKDYAAGERDRELFPSTLNPQPSTCFQ